MKEKSYNREYIKKKKSQQAFLTKSKFNPSQFHEPLKLLHPRKSQQRISNSLLQISSKDAFKRMNSLQIQPSQLSGLQQNRVTKPNQKIKKVIQHCWSQRHNIVINEPNKREKQRRFSSNSDFKQPQQIKQSHKRKLSLVEGEQAFQSNKKNSKIDKLNLITWLIIIRKLYVDQYLLRANKAIKINIIESYLNKIQNQHFQEFKLLIDPLDYELMLSKNNLISILKQFFTIPKTQLKDLKVDSKTKVTFYEIQNCLMQHELKNMIINNDKKQIKSSSSEQQAIQTARFQEGNTSQQQKKKKMLQSKNYIQNIVPKINNYKTFSKNNKQYLKFAGKLSSQKPHENISIIAASAPKSVQSSNPKLSPFLIPQNSFNQINQGLSKEKAQMVFKKGSFQYEKEKDESLGMITLQEKSPCYLRGSELFDLIQKDNSNIGKNNISFSTEHIQIESNLTLENAVSYFQQILKKNAIMLKDSISDDQSSLKDQNSYQIRRFLQQLINYRLSMSSESFNDQSYSYFVSFENLSQFKENSKKIMRQLLQNIYMKVYFNSLEGLKIRNSLCFLKSISNYIHPAIRILNISHNNISNLGFMLQQISHQNQMEFFNINNNIISDVTPILKTFRKLKELHCKGNMISIINDEDYRNNDLNMIDLSFNKIDKESSLIGLQKINSLNMINLLNNPLTKGDWKSAWKNTIGINKIYQMQNLYVMSAFGHQKDIAFSIEKKARKDNCSKNDKQELNDYNIKQFNSTCEQSLKMNILSSNKENIRELQKVTIKEIPKQKISNIKAYIDGKAI